VNRDGKREKGANGKKGKTRDDIHAKGHARTHGGPPTDIVIRCAYIHIYMLFIYIYIYIMFAHSRWHDYCPRHTSSEARDVFHPETCDVHATNMLVNSYREDWKLLSLSVLSLFRSLSLSLSLSAFPKPSAEARDRGRESALQLETVVTVRVEDRPQG